MFANRPAAACGDVSAARISAVPAPRADGHAASGPEEPERDPEGRRRAENGEHTHGQSLGAR